MFDGIAGQYDHLNRFLSARIDISWRKKAIRKLKTDKPPTNPGCGNRDCRYGYYGGKILNPQKIEGIDISVNMLDLGKKKIEGLGIKSTSSRAILKQ